MSIVVAALDNSAAAEPVVATAIRLAELYSAETRALHVREDGSEAAMAAARTADLELKSVSGPTVERLIAAASEPAVRAIVVGARGLPGGRRPAGRTALALITSVGKPVVVVPPDVSRPERIESVLVPLDGSRASAAALAGTISLARESGLEVVVLHVSEEERLPRFADHLQHEARVWAEEFIARNCPLPPEEVRLELRVGNPDELLVQVALETEADLIAMGWSQDLDAGHAAVVREALTRSPVPTFLLPVEPSS
jgi:nucleotide-binding universal stress UspA family protein